MSATVQTPGQEVSATVRRWLAFAQASGGPCFAGWPEEFLATWLRFHCGQRTLVVAVDDAARGLPIVGMAVGWQGRRADLERHWQADDPTGECFLVSQFAAVTRDARRALIGRMNERWPHWRTLEVYARRGAKGLVRYRPQLVDKLFNWDAGHGGDTCGARPAENYEYTF
jgi:hypothetical protein